MSDRDFQIFLALGPLLGMALLGFFARAIGRKIDGWDKSIQQNTEALTCLRENLVETKSQVAVQGTKIEATNNRFDSVERDIQRAILELRTVQARNNDDIEVLGDRTHGLTNAVLTLWGMAKHEGWKMPTEQPEITSRIRVKSH